MILLTSTSDQLQFTTSGVQSTDWNCSWNDMNFAASTMVPGSTEGNQAAVGTVVLISPPASGDQRQVKFLSIVNRDPTNTQNITVQKVGAAGTFNLTGSYPLQPGWSLQYVDSHGFMVLNAAGAIQYVGATGATGATGAGGPAGPYLILDADQGEEGMPIPGPVGPQGSTGLQGSQGVATYLEADPGDEGQPGSPGNPGATGATGAQGPQGVATFLDAEVIEPDLFVVPGSPGAAGGTGLQGPQGVATFLEGDIGPDGDIGPPGVTGATGATGATGPQGVATYLDAETFEPDLFVVPGSPGASGLTGAQGPAGFGPPGADGDQGDDGFPIPGNQGAQGAQGVQGLPGVAVLLDADQGDDGYSIPGNPGANGTNGTNGTNGAQGPIGPADLTWLAEVPEDQALYPPFDRNAVTQVTGLSLEIVLSSGSAITVTAAQIENLDAAVLILNSNSGAPKTVTLPASTGSLARILVIDGFGDAGTNNISFSPVPVGVGVIYTNKGQLWLTDTKTLGWVSGI